MFEWEEKLFLGLKALYQRFVENPREREVAAVRAELKPRRHELFLLANMIAGRPVSLLETPNSVLCDQRHVFLPPAFSAASTRSGNEELFVLKTLLGALAIRDQTTDPERLILQFPSLVARAEVAQGLLAEANLWEIFGHADFSKPLPTTDTTCLENVFDVPPQPEDITEIEGKGQTNVTVIEGEDDQPIESEMPIHTFEKAETLEEYSGLNRKTDDDDELDEHSEALRSVDMKHVVRTRERPRSIYRSDIVMDGLSFDVGGAAPESGIPYPEWDYEKQCHKPDWCFIRQHQLVSGDAVWARRIATKHRAVILDLRKKIAALATQTQRAKRQPDGPELDTDAMIASHVSRMSGHSFDERIYIQRQRKLHDVAALILMDHSYSTDAWQDDARVLDTIRETAFCVGEVMEEFVESFGVAAFSSNTRRQCDFHWIKAFKESWAGSRGRLGELEARGYTRIGPALRHAQELLMREAADRRVVFLITDGRPCDYDRYEGEYGIRDVRRAIESGARHGIMTHAFAIEKRAREQFPRMFNRNHYDVVADPRALVTSMCAAFARLKLVA